MSSSSKNVSQLLLAWSAGDEPALEQLTPFVYDGLHRLARRYMRRESPAHPLQPPRWLTEAYVRLIDQKQVRWQNRTHFFGIAAQINAQHLGRPCPFSHASEKGGQAQRR